MTVKSKTLVAFLESLEKRGAYSAFLVEVNQVKEPGVCAREQILLDLSQKVPLL